MQINSHELVKNKGNYFISFDLKTSMESILQHDSVKSSLFENLLSRKQPNTEVLRDIMDGECYKKLGLNGFEISCCINTDGVAAFNSSKFGFWPLLISFNELNYKLRRKYTILIGLWFGESKPNFDAFLQPFLEEGRLLSHSGVEWNFRDQVIVSKVFFPMFAADSPARCQIQRINQYNGEYSCPWCLSKGETFWIDERRHKWIFDPRIEGERRNHAQFIQHLTQLRGAISRNENLPSIFGIKAASSLILLPKFDIIDGLVFDYMHTCLLGVVKTLTCAWLDTKNRDKQFYIGNKEAEINLRLNRCKVPVECQRVVREVKDISYWKAHEWKVWMVLAVTLLKGILQDCYLKHFSKFTTAICILCRDAINISDVEMAQKLLKMFCFVLCLIYMDCLIAHLISICLRTPVTASKTGAPSGHILCSNLRTIMVY